MAARFHDRKEEIRSKLINAAQKAWFPTYEKFGETVGIWRMRGAREVLDEIAEEEVRAGNPDVTFILRSSTTGYPSQIGGYPAKPPNDEQARKAREEMQMVVDRYCPGATNPY